MPELTPHQKRALNYKEHISLTANAGSGKTFVLSKRFVEIALNENISLRSIAAITFTDKAAGDLYKKIASEIDDRIEAETDHTLKYKLENIRRQLVSANISTIHSFCIDIIREHPIEANVDANFTPIDETYSAELIEHSVEETLKENIKLEDGENKVKPLIRLFGSKIKLTNELKGLVENKKGILNLKEKIYCNDENEIADFYYEQFNRLFKVTILAQKDEVINALTVINNTVLDADKKNETAATVKTLISSINDENMLSVFSQIRGLVFTQRDELKKQKYLAEKMRGGLNDLITLLEKNLPEIADSMVPENHREIELELARTGKMLLSMAETALQKYDEKKREGGYLDFEDILILTQEILKLPEVREKLSAKYQYLMVDEYQDTNEIQYNIFLPILEFLQKNNLFVVGDEKQSIYMFRDAELEIFERTKQEIKKQGGEKGILELPDSFRMAPEICAFTNHLFAKLFRGGNPLYNEVKPNNIVCGRNDGVKGSVEFIISKKAQNEEAENLPALDELIAMRINRLVHDKSTGIEINYNNIAVLCRKRKSFPQIEKTFAKMGIPYTILGGKGFYQKQLVKDFYNYFAFLLNPENETALAGILRSPFFAIDDSVLYLISTEKGKDYWEKLKIHSGKNAKLKKAFERIEKNLIRKNSLDIASLFRNILDETNYISILSAQKNSDVELENLNKLISLSIDFFNEGFKTLYDYVVFLKESIDSFEDEGQAEPFVNEDVVKIMTIHQSKGLEFDAVFLYNLGEKTLKNMVKAKSVIADKNFGLLTKVPLNNDYFGDYHSAPIVKLANHITAKKEAAEMKRLFYVAVTRAKTHLFISAVLEKNDFSEESMIGQLQNALAVDFENENYEFKSELTFLLNGKDGYYNETRKINFDIPIISNVDYIKPEPENLGNETAVLKNMTTAINDLPENEIFSATKISTYMQCPLKYKLNYEFNFNSIFNDYLEWRKGAPSKNFKGGRNKDVESSKLPELVDENDRNIYPEIRGKIVHSVLQNEIKGEKLYDFIKEKLSQDIFLELQNEDEIKKLISAIKNEINNFYETQVYKELAAAQKWHNEFELFVKENDYILHGIIDKLVIDKDEITIIDYKTDDIEIDKLKERFNSYLSQLKFYSYIVDKHFKNYKSLKVRVIFIKHPALDFSEVIDKKSLTVLGNEYKTIINNIRNSVFDKNTGHCMNCIYSTLERKCIVE